MEERHYAFFQNTDCEYFPCHKTAHPERFNCLFCYCPLYALGRECGGNFCYTESGIKNCVNCMFPHRKENYRPLRRYRPENAGIGEGARINKVAPRRDYLRGDPL